ncbi:MAG: hypothetical protein HKM04_10510 [Legionellales bacterium]|nr:hypothetical protein [Legionellales bacterium]
MNKLIITFLSVIFFGNAFADQQIDNKNQQSDIQNEQVPTLTVGKIKFEVESLRVAAPNIGGHATIWLKITNNSNKTVCLNANSINAASALVNEYGVKWFLNGQNGVTGIGVMGYGVASTNNPLNPGESTIASIDLLPMDITVTNYGNQFNFSMEFVSYRDRGDGKLFSEGSYPVTFIGLHQSSVASNIQQDLKGAGSKVEGIFKSIFGN